MVWAKYQKGKVGSSVERSRRKMPHQVVCAAGTEGVLTSLCRHLYRPQRRMDVACRRDYTCLLLKSEAPRGPSSLAKLAPSQIAVKRSSSSCALTVNCRNMFLKTSPRWGPAVPEGLWLVGKLWQTWGTCSSRWLSLKDGRRVGGPQCC